MTTAVSSNSTRGSLAWLHGDSCHVWEPGTVERAYTERQDVDALVNLLDAGINLQDGRFFALEELHYYARERHFYSQFGQRYL